MRKVAGYGLGGRTQWGRRALSGSERAKDHTDSGSTRLERLRTQVAHAEPRSSQETSLSGDDHVVWDCSLHLQERRRNGMEGLEQY